MSDFDERYPHARTKQGKPHWPPGVRSISQDGLDWIGVDDDGHLYWDGQRLAVQKITLTTGQVAIAWIGVSAAVTVAAVELLRFFGMGA